jgi:hypothetical protein
MSIAVRRALYGKMAGDGTLTGLLGTPATSHNQSIYHDIAPKGSGYPYIVFSQQTGTPRYTLGSRAFDNDLWLVKGVDGNSDSDPVDAIASRLDDLLTDGTISISARDQLYLRRETDVVYSEVVDGVLVRHHGSLFRLIYE